jgi:hypothetical protein
MFLRPAFRNRPAVKTNPLVTRQECATLPACSCAQPFGGKTAKSTGTGASWRTVACAEAARCSRRCSTWGRSTMPSRPAGAARSRPSTAPAGCSWPCSPQTGSRRPTVPRCRSSWLAWSWPAPGSAWRLPRLWFDQSALADLLGEDFGIAEQDTLVPLSRQALGPQGGSLPAPARPLGHPVPRDGPRCSSPTCPAPTSRATRPSRTPTSGGSVTAATSAATACRWWWRWSSPQTASRSPTRAWRGTRRIAPRCAASSSGSSSSTARPRASG